MVGMPIIRVAHRGFGSEGTGRAPRVPDEVVGQGLSRSLPDNTAGIATWLDARELSRGGDLTRKRSAAKATQGPPCGGPHTERQPGQGGYAR
jgi:hypothetical protein